MTADGERIADEIRKLLGEAISIRPLSQSSSTGRALHASPSRAVYEAWVGRRASPDGVALSTVAATVDADDSSARCVASLLVDGGYLAQAGTLATNEGPLAVTVTARGLQIVGGWPATTAEAATGAFMAARERAIEEAEPERRSKLQRLREVALDVGQGRLTEVLKHVVTGGL